LLVAVAADPCFWPVEVSKYFTSPYWVITLMMPAVAGAAAIRATVQSADAMRCFILVFLSFCTRNIEKNLLDAEIGLGRDIAP